jgi:hypothetical protein
MLFYKKYYLFICYCFVYLVHKDVVFNADFVYGRINS